MSNPIAGKKVNFNDGKVDPMGRFWSGTMVHDWKSPIGALYKLCCDGTSHEIDSGMILSNGMGWSPDRRTMYFTDFAQRCIYAYTYNAEAGTIGVRDPLFDERDGFPDGITVDSQGGIWVAHWDGWYVTRHNPDGREVMRLGFPVPRPTSVMFGGRDLATLYVTSATMHLTEAELLRAPLSVRFLPFRQTGLPEPEFGMATAPQ